MDLVSFATALRSLKTIGDILKQIQEGKLSLQKTEGQAKLLEVMSTLVDARTEMLKLQELAMVQNAMIQRLNEQLKIRGTVKWVAPYYRLKSENSDVLEGQFCACCYDSDAKLIRLQTEGDGSWECKKCKNIYVDKSYQRVSVRTIPIYHSENF